MAGRRDFYEVLGLGRDAGADEIQRSYRKLARTYHPDINKSPDAELKFKEAAEAYDVLSNPETRKRYDAFGHDFRQVPDDVDPADWSRSRGHPSPGARPFDDRGQAWHGGDDLDLEDLLGGMFGGAGRRGWGPMPGADQEVELTLPLEEAYHGAHRSFTVSGADGSRRVEVTIPPGVTDGQRIRLAGQGGKGSGDAPPGDLYLNVRIAPDSRYRVDGRDLYVDLPVSAAEAALGAQVALTTPGGTAKVKVPPLTSSGKRLRLRGRGMPSASGANGDLYAEIRITMPTHLSDDARHAYEQVAATSSFDPRGRS